MLLDAGANPEAEDFRGRTPAFDKRDKNGWTPLHEAAAFNRVKEIDLLVKNGAKINLADKYGWPPLHTAVRYNQPESVEKLLALKAVVGSVDCRGWSPLDEAKNRGYKEIVALLEPVEKAQRPIDSLTTIGFQRVYLPYKNAADKTIPGDLIPERPTLICLGFKWYVQGDANRNATEVSRFWDGLSIAGPYQQDRDLQNCAIDFYNNKMREFHDDAIEMDYGVHNIRTFRNLIRNTFVGISTQPIAGRPGYIFRNVIYGTTNTPLKLNQYPAGLLIFNNTLVGCRYGTPAFGWQNSRIFNNLFIGGKAEWVISSGSASMTNRLDYNGYRFWPTGRKWTIRWQRTMPGVSPSGGGIGPGLSAVDLADLSRRSYGQVERHGIIVDYDTFNLCPQPRIPQKNQHEYPAIDLTLKKGSKAVDAGTKLLYFTDGSTNLAPDLGAYEIGRPLPHYGPRATPEKPDAHQH